MKPSILHTSSSNVEIKEENPKSRPNNDLIGELNSLYGADENESRKAGRPKKSFGQTSRKFSVRLIAEIDQYFLRLKGWKGQDLGKDSRRLKFLIKEHQIWEGVIKNYCSSVRRYIGHIEKELVSSDISPQVVSKMNDVYLLFGLYQIPLADHERYFSEKELRIIRLCITYSSNRKS